MKIAKEFEEYVKRGSYGPTRVAIRLYALARESEVLDEPKMRDVMSCGVRPEVDYGIAGEQMKKGTISFIDRILTKRL